MSESLLMHLNGQTVRALEDAVSRLSGAGNGQMLNDVDEALQVSRGLPNDVRALWRALWRRAATQQIHDYQQTGAQFLDIIDRAIHTLQRLRELANNQQQDDRTHAHAAEVDQAIDALRLQRQECVDRWPWITEAMVRETRAEIERGEYQTVREILDELRRARSADDSTPDRGLEPARSSPG